MLLLVCLLKTRSLLFLEFKYGYGKSDMLCTNFEFMFVKNMLC
jgi:hypothetical protein